MRQPAQQFVATVVMNDRLAHDGAKPRHAVAEPFRHAPAVKWKISTSRSLRHVCRLFPCLPCPSTDRYPKPCAEASDVLLADARYRRPAQLAGRKEAPVLRQADVGSATMGWRSHLVPFFRQDTIPQPAGQFAPDVGSQSCPAGKP